MAKRIAPRYLRQLPDMSAIMVKVKGMDGRFKGMIAREMQCVIALSEVGDFEMWAEIPFKDISYWSSRVKR